MNRVSILGIGFTVIAAIAAAQDKDKVTVPLSSPSQPATVRARLIIGSITVTAGTGPEVVIESEAGGRGGDRGRGPDRNATVPPGMHRIDAGGHGFNVEEDHNVVTVIPDNGG